METGYELAVFAAVNLLMGVAAWRAGRALGGGLWTDAMLGAGVCFFAGVVAVSAVLGFAGALGWGWFLAAAALVCAGVFAVTRALGADLTPPVVPHIPLRPIPAGFFLSSRRLLSQE